MIANYFTALIEGSFKLNEKGDTIFFPWGRLRKGVVVPDLQSLQRLKDFLKRFYLVGFLAPTPAYLFVILCLCLAHQINNVLLVLSAIVLTYVAECALLYRWYARHIHNLTNGFALSDTKLTWRDAAITNAKFQSPAFLWIMEVLCIGYSIGALSMSFYSRQWLLGLPVFLMFGIFSVLCAYIWSSPGSVDGSLSNLL